MDRPVWTGLANFKPGQISFMLKDTATQVSIARDSVRADKAFDPVETITGDDAAGLLLLCDHAVADVPAEYGDLGVGGEAWERHIASDIGAGPLTRGLATRLDAPALLTRFSRLLIDPNRGEDDPTLVMRISDRVVVPGNAGLDERERAHRLNAYHRPYHNAIERKIAAMTAAGCLPILLSIHSFTHSWRGSDRPWHIGILWDKDPRLAVPLIDALRGQKNLVVGDNEPYIGSLVGDTMNRHGTGAGIAHALVEVRQDLITSPDGVEEWADRLAAIMEQLVTLDGLHELVKFGSRSDN
jgi:predicted N-formylglutamate amidohydrolase